MVCFVADIPRNRHVFAIGSSGHRKEAVVAVARALTGVGIKGIGRLLAL